jgi:C4-dicarboxylate transporter DctM subunit
MLDVNTTLLLIGILLLTVFLGFHVAVAMGMASVIGLLVATDSWELTRFFIGSTAYEALRDYVFAIVPLFMLMGEFIARSGAATDVYVVIDRSLTRLRGRHAHATVLGNAIFAFVTGTSFASATAFARIAYPEMLRYRYNKTFALGSIAGSACLGMLIPPSLFMVVWGILTDQSIGILFIAGVIPGLLLAGMMLLYIFIVGLVRPDIVGHVDAPPVDMQDQVEAAAHAPGAGLREWTSFVGLTSIIVVVLGGIWAGFFSPTEGAGIGAVAGLALGIVKGMRLRDVYETVLAVARTSVPFMTLLFVAQLYSRTLAIAGVGAGIQDLFLNTGLGPLGIFAIMVLIWFIMGMLIDSVSIMLLTVPIFGPIAVSLGYDPVAFAIMGIVTIEAGILTPPFGLLVYAVRAVVNEPDVTLNQIFMGSTPYWIMLLLVVVLIYIWPATATWLPFLLI